ncbi:MAG: redoxin family protein [Planctomycetes bacterium]|nr:redoxin family protein [Planctomycetota bacterium]
MKVRAFASLAVALLAGAPALAASPQVGEEAPDFTSATWVMNEPRQASIRALRGEVVFVEKWGVKCPPCLALIPHIQQLQDEFGGKGLHIFAFEAQNHSADEVRTTVTGRGGRTYAVSAGGAANYQTNGGIPHGWLIGVDGKVIWEGNPGDGRFDQLLRAEMAKVRFPGLGRNDFDRALAKSLEKYMRRDIGAARKEAQKVLDHARSSDAAKADAQDLLARYQGIVDGQWALAQQHEAERRYLEAQEIYTWLAGTLKREELGDQADERLDAMKKDDGIKRELEAMKRLRALQAQLQGRPAEERRVALERFASDDKVAGTRAAEDAREAAGRR